MTVAVKRPFPARAIHPGNVEDKYPIRNPSQKTSQLGMFLWEIALIRRLIYHLL